MHELSVTESLLNTAIEYAQKNRASSVKKLTLTIGSLSGIIGESVQFYWDMVSKNTLCEQTCLEFNHITAKFECRSCGNAFEIGSDLTPCPACSSMDLVIIQGKEFLLESIEIETLEEQ